MIMQSVGADMIMPASCGVFVTTALLLGGLVPQTNKYSFGAPRKLVGTDFVHLVLCRHNRLW
jgi:hypothetical protein